MNDNFGLLDRCWTFVDISCSIDKPVNWFEILYMHQRQQEFRHETDIKSHIKPKT